jgi:4-oxalocrotonate tautomerase
MNFNCYQGKLTCFRGKYQVIRANRTDNKWLKKSVSVAFEEIEKENWAEKVYKPDILNRKSSLYKEPGYNPFE